MIAPLIAQRELLGYLYCDIDGAFGRFRDADRDLIGMLASQAAVALDNAQWSQGLEQKVAQRTEELSASKAVIEQRANELAIINSIQEGMAAELDFQAIVDLVGDKLREVFHTGDIGIRWVRSGSQAWCTTSTSTSTARASIPSPQSGDVRTRRSRKKMQAREPWCSALDPSRRRWGSRNIPGTDASRSSVIVPDRGRRSRAGLDRHGGLRARDHAFGESAVRLLSTVAASMGVALENARLFDETQRLLKETEQRAAELAVINSIQEGWLPSSTSRRSSIWSATSCARCSTRATSASAWFEPKQTCVHHAGLRLRARRAAHRRAAEATTPAPKGICVSRWSDASADRRSTTRRRLRRWTPPRSRH